MEETCRTSQPFIECSAISSNNVAILSSSGEQLGAGEHGELCVRGHNVMYGYINQSDDDPSTLENGWLHTGDEGFYLIDNRGRQFLFVTGKINS